MKGLACTIAFPDKHCHMYLNTKDCCAKQISHLTEGMVIVAFPLGQLIVLNLYFGHGFSGRVKVLKAYSCDYYAYVEP